MSVENRIARSLLVSKVGALSLAIKLGRRGALGGSLEDNPFNPAVDGAPLSGLTDSNNIYFETLVTETFKTPDPPQMTQLTMEIFN